jgi:hypothetical protein
MSRELFQKIRDFNFPVGQFAVFGSGPMCIRGLRECRDIDIILTEKLFARLQNDPQWEAKRLHDGNDYLAHDEIELYKDWGPGEWDVGKLIREAEMIEGLPFVRLDEVIAWKTILGREKDIKDLQLINSYLRRLEC